MIFRITALARALIRNPVAPSSLLELINTESAFKAFRDIVRMVLPERYEEIMAAGGQGGTPETERCWAFCQAFEREYFPIYEGEEYGHVAWGIPFVHEGWSADDFHDFSSRSIGDLLISAFCQEPYEPAIGARVPLMDEVCQHIPVELAKRVAADGFSPRRLHAALKETRFTAVCDYIDWMWGMTGTAFLDFSDEMEVYDADWTMEIVEELKAGWRNAQAIMARIAELSKELQANPVPLFTQILELVEAVPEPEGDNDAGDDTDDDQHREDVATAEGGREFAAVTAGALSLGQAPKP